MTDILINSSKLAPIFYCYTAWEGFREKINIGVKEK